MLIGRVCVATSCYGAISECINLIVDGESFPIRVLEDMIELMDFSPRYEVGFNNENGSVGEDDDNSANFHHQVSPAGSIVIESKVVAIDDTKRHILEFEHGRDILDALNNLDV